jgi:hypothetical protein|uniref:Uncharacterized protein n=1 Tax=Zea mays TaxID=4577 RepID=A0A804P715_MAIZE
MARSAVAVRRAALAIVFGGLLLMSLVMDDVKKAAIGGRRMLARGDGRGQSTLEDFQAADVPFQDSKRRVPNGPDPIHNRYLDLYRLLHCTASLVLVFEFVPLFPCHYREAAVAISVPVHRFHGPRRFRLEKWLLLLRIRTLRGNRYCV